MHGLYVVTPMAGTVTVSGRHPFSELRKRMAPERRVRNAWATRRMLVAMRLRESVRRGRRRSGVGPREEPRGR